VRHSCLICSSRAPLGSATEKRLITHCHRSTLPGQSSKQKFSVFPPNTAHTNLGRIHFCEPPLSPPLQPIGPQRLRSAQFCSISQLLGPETLIAGNSRGGCGSGNPSLHTSERNQSNSGRITAYPS
jgi:hypothetical protein